MSALHVKIISPFVLNFLPSSRNPEGQTCSYKYVFLATLAPLPRNVVYLRKGVSGQRLNLDRTNLKHQLSKFFKSNTVRCVSSEANNLILPVKVWAHADTPHRSREIYLPLVPICFGVDSLHIHSKTQRP